MFITGGIPIEGLLADPHPVFLLISVIINAILEVFFLCLVGWILARRGILNDQAKQTLNKLNVNLFTPALLFSKVAFSLTPDKFEHLIIIPVGFVLLTTLSAGIAWCLGTVMRLKPGQRNFAMACAMFQNSNSLPIALMQSFIGEGVPLQWNVGDSQDDMLGRALTYLVLFSTLGIIIRWSIGVRLLTSAESITEDGEEVANASDTESTDSREGSLYDDEESTLLSSGRGPRNGALPSSGTNGFRRTTKSKNPPPAPYSRPRTPSTNSSSTIVPSPTVPHSAPPILTHEGNLIVLDDHDDVAAAAAVEQVPHSAQPTLERANKLLSGHPTSRNKKPQSIFHSFPSTPMPSVDRSGYNSVDEEEWAGRRAAIAEAEEAGVLAKAWLEFVVVRGTVWRVTRPVRKVGTRIGAFMTVPLWAALLSLLVACIPPLQGFLNEIEPFKAAVRNAGNCSVPITLVVLGAYFYIPCPPPIPRSQASSTFSAPVLAPHSSSRMSMSTSFLSLRSLNIFKRGSLHLHDSAEQLAESNAARETRTVIVAVASRMVIVPAILLPLFGFYVTRTTNVADDPVFVVVGCLLIGSPTAITLSQMTSAASGSNFEKLISRTLFVSYAVMTAPCTIVLVLVALFIDARQ